MKWQRNKKKIRVKLGNFIGIEILLRISAEIMIFQSSQ